MEDILGDDQPAGTDELRSIVARAGKRRWRTVAASAAVALCAGGGIGYAVSNHSSPAQTVVAGNESTANKSSGNGGASGSSSIGSPSAEAPFSPAGAPAVFANGTKLTPLFTRTSGDITIRAFLAELPTYPSIYGAETCGLPMLQPQLRVEVSTPKMVGLSYGYTSAATSAVKSSQASVLGVAEGDPVTVVAADTSTSVANLRFVGTSGQADQMSPVKGWAVLAVHGSSGKATSVGSVVAQSATGATLQKTAANLGFNPLPTAPEVVPGCYCHGVLPATGNSGIYNGGVASGGSVSGSGGGTGSGGGSGSSGASGSGSASGSGASGSGTASPGTATAAPLPSRACPMIPAGGTAQGATSSSK